MNKLRIAAMSDLHVRTSSVGFYRDIFLELNSKADILVLCGDLTDNGMPEEAEILAQDLNSLTIPVVGVLGNHDHASDSSVEVKRILTTFGKMYFVDEEPFEINGVGFAGVKGFCGGFGKYMLGGFGEERLKNFVYETINESLRLEELLKQIKSEKKVVLLHYAPIRETLEGEPLEIYPFMGSSRLEEPINNYDVTMAFHGHTHHGKHLGKTTKGIPVYNVSLHVLKNEKPALNFLIVEV